MFPFQMILQSNTPHFVENYFAFCSKTQHRRDIEKGGKIIMPPSALSMLSHYGFASPLQFKLTSRTDTTRYTHVGVLEFVAPGRKIILPTWMMRNLGLKNGSKVTLRLITLPTATFSKFQPQSKDFLDITNAKAVLENSLRNFACLTVGDLIFINYNKKSYGLKVLETKPNEAVNIVECDMNVEFDQPLDYVEEQVQTEEELYYDVDADDDKTFAPFSGEGQRLNGKRKKEDELVPVKKVCERPRGIPDYDHQIGFFRFWRPKEDAPEMALPSSASTSMD